MQTVSREVETKEKRPLDEVDVDPYKATQPSKAVKASVASQEQHAARLAAMPQFATLGALHKSSKPVELTEAETEYVVSVVKHIYPNHLVLEYTVTNTLNEQVRHSSLRISSL